MKPEELLTIQRVTSVKLYELRILISEPSNTMDETDVLECIADVLHDAHFDVRLFECKKTEAYVCAKQADDNPKKEKLWTINAKVPDKKEASK